MREHASPVYSSVKELAAELGIAQSKAYRHLNEGTIPAIKLDGRFIIPRAAIQSWLASAGGRLQVGASPQAAV